MLNPRDLFDLSHFAHAALFDGCEYAWQALPRIKNYISERFAQDLEPGIHTEVGPGVIIEGDVYIGQGTLLDPQVTIKGPAIIGDHCQVRQGAFIRGNMVTGAHCVVGHATEVKNSIFLEGAQASHFAYVGDSILGNRVNMGAGTKLANLPLMSIKDSVTGKRPTVRLRLGDQVLDTDLAKLGAIIGDDSQTGCNSVLNPGCIIGPRTLVYALVSLRKGYYPADSVIKLEQRTALVDRTE
jgi:NDP-sugar pyrophosphorylase family protein